jgi:cobalt-zinc-cadmium efflux system outer membrane protein
MSLAISGSLVSAPVICGPGPAGDTGLPAQLTLREALARFRAGGFDLLLADADVETAAGDLSTATAVANPTAEAGFLHSFFADNLFETHNGWQVGLGDSNAIVDALSGKRGLRGRVARAALDAAKMRRLDVQRALELQVKAQFVAAAAAQAMLQVSGEIRESAERTFLLNQVRFARGAISEVDLARTETARLEAEQSVDTAVQTLVQAKVSLAFLVGQRSPAIGFDVDPAEIRFRVPAVLAGATEASLIETARRARPDLLGGRDQTIRAAAAASLARRSRFPDLGIGVQYQQQGSTGGGPSGAQPISPPTVQISLSGSIPLFYQQQGEIQRADADLAAHQALVAKTEAQVVSDVEAAFAGFQTARVLVARMEGRLLDRARRARELTALQYEKGAASLLEYLDAQRTFSAVSAEYWQDLANYWNAVFQLEAATATELSS